jgi:aspartyl-tRNA(Asn)/glutamyl-tRNA(Gln) amidotransferase subunit A
MRKHPLSTVRVDRGEGEPMKPLEQCDLVEVADTIAARRLSSREVTAWTLQRPASTGRELNAVFRIDHDDVMQRAAVLDAQQASGLACGPLHGVPLAHKDLFGVAGRECHAAQAHVMSH